MKNKGLKPLLRKGFSRHKTEHWQPNKRYIQKWAKQTKNRESLPTPRCSRECDFHHVRTADPQGKGLLEVSNNRSWHFWAVESVIIRVLETFYLWSGEENNGNNAYKRNFNSSNTNWNNNNRNNSNNLALCLGDEKYFRLKKKKRLAEIFLPTAFYI